MKSNIDNNTPQRQHTAAEQNMAAEAFETHDALMITDADSNIIRVNRAFEEITGYFVFPIFFPKVESSGI